MIKINVVAVGKVKEQYFAAAIEEYKKRLSAFCTVTVTEVKEAALDTPARILAAESGDILRLIKGKTYSLAIEGQKLSSEEFASIIKSAVDSGTQLTFIIGSSHGLDKTVKAASSSLISFSDMTFPHTMARVMLFEQIYRAFTIISGKTYHK